MSTYSVTKSLARIPSSVVSDRVAGAEASITFNPLTGRLEGTAKGARYTERPATLDERIELADRYQCHVPAGLIIKVY